jgi:hypothetical protein
MLLAASMAERRRDGERGEDKGRGGKGDRVEERDGEKRGERWVR